LWLEGLYLSPKTCIVISYFLCFISFEDIPVLYTCIIRKQLPNFILFYVCSITLTRLSLETTDIRSFPIFPVIFFSFSEIGGMQQNGLLEVQHLLLLAL
jgi:hypothetical protein